MLFLLISKKHVKHAFLSFPCLAITSNFLITHYFHVRMVVLSCVHVPFYFSLPLIFTLLAAAFWPLAFLIFSPPLWISAFFFLRNSSPLFSMTRSSSFSVIQPYLCKHQKTTPKKTRLFLFFWSSAKNGEGPFGNKHCSRVYIKKALDKLFAWKVYAAIEKLRNSFFACLL